MLHFQSKTLAGEQSRVDADIKSPVEAAGENIDANRRQIIIGRVHFARAAISAGLRNNDSTAANRQSPTS